MVCKQLSYHICQDLEHNARSLKFTLVSEESLGWWFVRTSSVVACGRGLYIDIYMMMMINDLICDAGMTTTIKKNTYLLMHLFDSKTEREK